MNLTDRERAVVVETLRRAANERDQAKRGRYQDRHHLVEGMQITSAELRDLAWRIEWDRP